MKAALPLERYPCDPRLDRPHKKLPGFIGMPGMLN